MCIVIVRFTDCDVKNFEINFSFLIRPFSYKILNILTTKMAFKMKEKVLLIEAVVQRCSMKKVFLEISQNSQENICAGVSFLIKLQA